MQVLESHIGNQQHPAGHIREQSAMEFENVVSRYLSAFYRRAYRYVGNPHDAEDAVQDALLSAYKHLDRFKRAAKMTTWLTTIVTNSALTQLRRRPRHSQLSLDQPLDGEQSYSVSDRLTDQRPSPEGESISSEIHGNLIQSVMELSPLSRKAIQLFYLDGLSTKEVARILGVPQGTVKARMSRARSQLKRRMRAV